VPGCPGNRCTAHSFAAAAAAAVSMILSGGHRLAVLCLQACTGCAGLLVVPAEPRHLLIEPALQGPAQGAWCTSSLNSLCRVPHKEPRHQVLCRSADTWPWPYRLHVQLLVQNLVEDGVLVFAVKRGAACERGSEGGRPMYAQACSLAETTHAACTSLLTC